MTDGLLPLLAGTLIALGPGVALLLFVARRQGVLWKAFLWGWAGWFLALLLRLLPVQVPALLYATAISEDLLTALLYFAYASALAGLVEEGFRYFLLRMSQAPREGFPFLLAFGLGWGIGEAVILYVATLAALALTPSSALTLAVVLPGALERNLAIAAHVALTVIVYAAMGGRRALLGAAMLLHFALNFLAAAVVLLTQNVWWTEGAVAAVALGITLIAYRLHRRGRTLPMEDEEKGAGVRET